LVTGCGSFCVAPEKKLAILSFKDGELDDEGDAAGAAAGVEGTDAVVAGTPRPLPLPLHPLTSSRKASNVPAGARSRRPYPLTVRLVSRLIANSRSPLFIANKWQPSQGVARLG
jgi:hypothetical protein